MSEMGLLNGVSEGLRLGLQGFQGERDRRDKRALAEADQENKRLQLAQALAKETYDRQKDRAGLIKEGYSPVAQGQSLKPGLVTTQLGDETLSFDPSAKKDWNPNPLQSAQLENALAEAAKRKTDATPAGKYASAPAEVKGKVGNITNALSSLSKVEDAYSRGVEPQYLDSSTPLVGKLISDNDFTSAQRLMNEEVGRLQSGGAITKEELTNFKALDPTPGDTPDIKKSKLVQKREWLENKLAAFGVKKENLAELGFDPKAMGLMREPKKPDEKLAGPGLLKNIKPPPMTPEQRQKRIKELRAKLGN